MCNKTWRWCVAMQIKLNYPLTFNEKETSHKHTLPTRSQMDFNDECYSKWAHENRFSTNELMLKLITISLRACLNVTKSCFVTQLILLIFCLKRYVIFISCCALRYWLNALFYIGLLRTTITVHHSTNPLNNIRSIGDCCQLMPLMWRIL